MSTKFKPSQVARLICGPECTPVNTYRYFTIKMFTIRVKSGCTEHPLEPEEKLKFLEESMKAVFETYAFSNNPIELQQTADRIMCCWLTELHDAGIVPDHFLITTMVEAVAKNMVKKSIEDVTFWAFREEEETCQWVFAEYSLREALTVYARAKKSTIIDPAYLINGHWKEK